VSRFPSYHKMPQKRIGVRLLSQTRVMIDTHFPDQALPGQPENNREAGTSEKMILARSDDVVPLDGPASPGRRGEYNIDCPRRQMDLVYNKR
jgi:hypothetical protein